MSQTPSTDAPGKTDATVEIVRDDDDDAITLRCGAAQVRLALRSQGATGFLSGVSDDDGRAPDTAIAALARALGREAADCHEIVTWDHPKRARLNDALRALRFIDHRRKLFVVRDLSTDLPLAGEFGWRSLAEIGEEEFIALMTRSSADDPFPAADFDPHEEWRGLLAHAGASFDAHRWRVATVDGQSVGVVLPTPYPNATTEGTLSYVGVLPEYRGRGLGRALHASGLHLLAEAGCTVYNGSTDQRNAPMARVFERNGCRVDGIQLILLPPPRSGT